MEENNKTENTVKKSGVNPAIPLALVGLIIIIAIGIFAYQGQQNGSSESVNRQGVTPTSISEQTNNLTPPITTADSEYNDGEYSAEGDYTSPGGAENLGVTITLKDGIIENAEVETMGSRPNTVRFQGIFKENFKQLVVGKDIDDVKLDKVSGSSLSPKGFNDALEKIKTQAKA